MVLIAFPLNDISVLNDLEIPKPVKIAKYTSRGKKEFPLLVLVQ
jgi:hypothetical protein